MKSEARRTAIVQAVIPVFARKGLNEATSRELADAAEISEALLFKHFPTKESLFAEVQAVCCDAREPGVEKLAGLEPSTATLVRILYHLVRSAALAAPHDDHQSAMRHRLFLGSCLADGAFGRAYFRDRFSVCLPGIDACLSAAEKAGDLVESPIRREDRLRFVHHLGTMVAAMHLPSRPALNYGTSGDELVNEVVWFCLRGFGMTDAAIRRHFCPRELAAFFGTTSVAGVTRIPRSRRPAAAHRSREAQ